uniref:Uncharacterized protein n=1 Tax=Chromera velia CCMP2878 TaxID=1169474 RepID=A0A0G4H3G4_9ALVE|eukprot:Cvel_5620.t1-p1 / transcript=Cvel_5620.t1 / gene=Cvel_5620 / organism=Chromera_velia_CCMP2878 / gene_product=hypothetical protein / transcript_product=hypothetical protein / location=Cvel_scaffold264:102698-103732(-) / protein_length=345 / sequence_SO=supercontig / SO=protein_coding / is_pseudo=false
MGLYRLPCAAQLFDHKLEGVCKELGFKRLDTAIAVKAPPEGGRAYWQAIVMNWIDDLLTGAPPKEHKVFQETFNKRLGFGSMYMIGEGSERKFSGVDISRVSTEEIHLSQVSYLENTDTAPLWEILKKKRSSKPWKGLDGKSAEPSTEEEVNNQYEKPIRAGVGTLQWGMRMNLLHAVWGHTVAQSITKPSRRVFKTVVHIIEMLKGHPDKQVFTSVGFVPVVHAYFDAAFKFATYAAQLGYVVRILHSIELRRDLLALQVLCRSPEQGLVQTRAHPVKERVGVERTVILQEGRWQARCTGSKCVKGREARRWSRRGRGSGERGQSLFCCRGQQRERHHPTVKLD